MKKLVVLLMACALCGFTVACSEDEGVSKSDMSETMCEKSKDCDLDEYAESGGDDSCTQMMEEFGFSGLFCPEFNSDKAAECQDALADQSCDDYGDGQPTVCDEICGEMFVE